jgi:RNA polymerase sigma-70 factor (ECF subfamily)
MDEISDAELMDRYARGDAGAFDQLFDRYDLRIFAFFMGRARCPDRAADLHQEVFLRLHRFRDRFDPARPFGPWIFALARNVWHDELRRRHGLVEVDAQRALEAVDESFESQVLSRDHARQLLDTLAPRDRELVLATAVAGFTYAELAPPSRRSVDSLKQAGSRALRKLRRRSAEAGI